MRKTVFKTLATLLAIATLVSPAAAERATDDEAWNVANNWVTLIIHINGDWGGSDTAAVEEIQEFKRGERVLGYFCRVQPRGFIVVSLHKELAPVKANSAITDLDPESGEGLTDVIKAAMERVLAAIEPPNSQDIQDILEINYRPAWDCLCIDTDSFIKQLRSGAWRINYQEGDVLLSSLWHQREPYNDQCPNRECNWRCNSNNNALVGCVATAGAQIMRHWNWPPYGSGTPYDDPYDWRNMPDTLEFNANCDPLPQAQVDAVAELCHEVGVAVDMEYGCSASGAYTYNMEGVYETHYRYSDYCVTRDRNDYTAVQWFNRLKEQFNVNRPVQYRIVGHSLVADGWRETDLGGGNILREYHMNYGHGHAGDTMWYTLDAHPGYDEDEDYILEDIVPAQALGSSLAGTYLRWAPFPYRYFDQDATGDSATFREGQYLQFLYRITVMCTSTIGGSIRFEGSSGLNTRLFTRGDPSNGVRIYDGTIKLNENGSIRLP